MVYKQTTAPTELAITVADAKAQLNIELAFTADDALIESFIRAAALHVEKIIQGPLMNQIWELQMTGFKSCMEIFKTPVSAIGSLKYFDNAEADQTVAASNYLTDLASVPARVILKSTYTVPTVYSRFDAVRIAFTAGYANAAAVPHDIQQAIKLLVTHFYENRVPEIAGATVAKLNLSIEQLLVPHRLWV